MGRQLTPCATLFDGVAQGDAVGAVQRSPCLCASLKKTRRRKVAQGAAGHHLRHLPPP